MANNIDKKTIVLETRVSLETFCKALLYLKENSASPRSRGEAVSLCIAGIASLYEGEMPETTEERLHLLQTAFGSAVNLGRNAINRTKVSGSLRGALQKEAVQADETSLDDLLTQSIKRYMER